MADLIKVCMGDVVLWKDYTSCGILYAISAILTLSLPDMTTKPLPETYEEIEEQLNSRISEPSDDELPN